MAGLQHSFVHGIRFDTDVEYRVQGRWGARYRTLPIQLPVRCAAAGEVDPADGGLLSAMQCISLVCQKPFRQVLQWFVSQGLTEIDQLALAPGLRWDGKCVQFETIHTSHAKTVGLLALQFIRNGHTCMVQFASRQGSRWATVVGVEWQARDDVRDQVYDDGCDGEGGGRTRALLLLDPQAGAPWACGHNARLELWHGVKPATGVGATAKLRYLSGEVWPVQIRQLIRVGLSSQWRGVQQHSLAEVTRILV